MTRTKGAKDLKPRKPRSDKGKKRDHYKPRPGRTEWLIVTLRKDGFERTDELVHDLRFARFLREKKTRRRRAWKDEAFERAERKDPEFQERKYAELSQ